MMHTLLTIAIHDLLTDGDLPPREMMNDMDIAILVLEILLV